MSGVRLYDRFSQSYDLFISWDSRLDDEAPFFEDLFAENNVRSVLDVGCGTGMHAILFAKWGLRVVGSDLSLPMIEKAKANARNAGLKISFVCADFADLARRFRRPFDVVTCLGNSLPHVLSDREIRAALRSFRDVLRPEGLLVIHNLNYDRIDANRQRFLNPKHAHRGGRDFLFLRFFDFPPRSTQGKGSTWTFNVVTLMREESNWRQHIETTVHRPLKEDELRSFTRQAGFEGIVTYGNYQRDAFKKKNSDLLLMVARKSSRAM